MDPAQPTNNLHFQASVYPVNVLDWEQATEHYVPESLMAAEGPITYEHGACSVVSSKGDTFGS